MRNPNTLHEKFLKVTNRLIEKKLKTEKISVVVLGGSVARGDETGYSDIDINFFVNQKLKSPVHSFYRFKGKFVEETIFSVDAIKDIELAFDSKILFDSGGYALKFKKPVDPKKKFLTNWKNNKATHKKAERLYKNGKYEESIFLSLGTKSLVFNLVHELPQLFQLPFPSFRLLKSVNIASAKLRDSKIYGLITQIYGCKGYTQKEALRDLKIYSKAYTLFGKLYRKNNPKMKNFGFYQPMKIKFNIRGLRQTIVEESPIYARRFMVNSIISWSLGSEETLGGDPKETQRLKQMAKKIVGSEFDKNFAREILKLNKELVKKIDSAIKRLK